MAHRTIRAAAPPTALARESFPPAVLDVLRTLHRAGHRSWLVGGAVRDVLLRRPRRADLDVATPARPEQVVALFARTIPTGIEHGTVTVLSRGTPVEVTTFRGEGAYVDGRRPSSVTFLDDVDGDLSRRDFTVNAMAWDPLGGEFRDPFGGRADLRRRVLRAVGDPSVRFAEDGLRPLRAARFAAQLGFEVEERTAAAIPGALATAARVAVERTTDELSKLVVASQALRGLELLDASGLLGVVLPRLAAAPASARRHAFAVTAAAPPELSVRLAALLHALDAPGDAAARETIATLAAMRFPGAVRDGAAALVTHHRCLAARPGPFPRAPADLRRWLSRVGPQRAAALVALARAEVQGLGSGEPRRAARAELAAFVRRLGRVRASDPPLVPSALALDGGAVMRTLGVPPGPLVGAAIRHLLDEVLEEPALNTRARLTSALRAWAARRTDAPSQAMTRAQGTRSGARRGGGRTR